MRRSETLETLGEWRAMPVRFVGSGVAGANLVATASHGTSGQPPKVYQALLLQHGPCYGKEADEGGIQTMAYVCFVPKQQCDGRCREPSLGSHIAGS